MTVSIQEEFSWLVTMKFKDRLMGYSPRYRRLQNSFRSIGFRILELPNEYYNPTIKRFIVKHSKLSTMTLWRLQHGEFLTSGVTVDEQ